MSTLEARSMARNDMVVAVWSEPFKFGPPDVRPFREGSTIFEIVQSYKSLPAKFMERGVVHINGHEIKREFWHLVRPKVSTATRPVAVTLSYPLQGGGAGGQGSTKQIIAIVAALALTVATAGISSGLAATTIAGTALFTAGSTSAAILAGAVGLAGALAISALTKPPTSKQKDDRTDQAEAASADGNRLEPNGAIPRVIGTRKIFPPLASEPRVYLEGDDEYAEALYVLNGPHAISDIKVDDASIDDDDAIEYQVREGFQDDLPQTLIDKVGKVTNGNLELKGHKLASGSDFNLEDQENPDKSLPKWQRIAAGRSPDEIHLHLLWPAGISYSEDGSITIVQPLRFRMRQVGDTDWINLPELHFAGNERPTQIRAQVIIHWDYAGEQASVIPGGGAGCWAFAHLRPPAQTVAPADSTYQWEANDHFYDGAGTRYVSYSDSSSGIQNLGFSRNPNSYEAEDEYLRKNTAHIYLDSATFPKGTYEIEVMRGSSYRLSLFNISTYIYQSNLLNHFKYYGTTFRVTQTQRSIQDSVAIARVVSVWEENPCPMPGFTQIAVRVKNKSISRLSCTASGYIYDWDGSGWNTLTTTSNPAPHFRDILAGRLNLDPLPVSLIDEDSLTNWRSACTSNDYTCDYIAEDIRIEDLLSIVASCGYAQPYYSEVWGVIRDYDRSGESPIQVFTPANSEGFKFRKALARLPDGFRVSYRSDADDYTTNQVNVYRSNKVEFDTSRIEQVTYEGLPDETKVTARAAFDLRQGELRSTFYQLDAPVEYIKARRGSLVAAQNDILTRHIADGRVIRVNRSGGNVVSLVLDIEVTIPSTYDILDVPDVLAVDDMLAQTKLGCSIRRTNGTISTHQISNTAGSSRTITFTTPFSDGTTTGGPFDDATINQVEAGCLVCIGPLGQEYLRLIVSEIVPGPDLTAKLTLVDEAPALFA